ncbi:unnamed protein product [Taenia asiatica]|uniref:Expressed conserved protein n=1 Tax=Taenia asiatica TaxID=60517 RepID=A0A0R3VY66_TAEAS|nr:unnamed protein product [Taenia asiatica]
MDRRLMYVSFAFAAAFLFFVAIGYSGWECNGSLLSADCRRRPYNEIIAILHLTAALAIFIAGIFLVLLVVFDHFWSLPAACILIGVSVILSMTGVIYHADVNLIWPPVIVTVAMTLSVALLSNLIFDLIEKYYKS